MWTSYGLYVPQTCTWCCHLLRRTLIHQRVLFTSSVLYDVDAFSRDGDSHALWWVPDKPGVNGARAVVNAGRWLDESPPNMVFNVEGAGRRSLWPSQGHDASATCNHVTPAGGNGGYYKRRRHSRWMMTSDCCLVASVDPWFSVIAATWRPALETCGIMVTRWYRVSSRYQLNHS